MAIASQTTELNLAFIGEKNGLRCTIIPYEAVVYCTAEEYQFEDKWGDPVSSSGVTVVMESGKVWLRGDDAIRFCQGYFNYIEKIEQTKAVDEKLYDLIKKEHELKESPPIPRKRRK